MQLLLFIDKPTYYSGTPAVFFHNRDLLNENLEKKVNERTHELKDANYELSILNARLEKEKFRSELELEMASIVQRKFFPQPIKHFKGWDIAICYEPLAEEFNLSTVHCRTRVERAKKQLFTNI